MLTVIVENSEEPEAAPDHPDIRVALKVQPAQISWVEPTIKKYVQDCIAARMRKEDPHPLHDAFRNEMEKFGGLARRSIVAIEKDTTTTSFSHFPTAWRVPGTGVSLLTYALHLFVLHSVAVFTESRHGTIMTPYLHDEFLSFLSDYVKEKRIGLYLRSAVSEPDSTGKFKLSVYFQTQAYSAPYPVVTWVNFQTGETIMQGCGNAASLQNALPWLPPEYTTLSGGFV